MRILMLSPEDVGSAHGGAVHTLSMADAFVKLGHEVMLVAPMNEGWRRQVSTAERSVLASTSWTAGDRAPRWVTCSMRLFGIASTWRALPLASTCRAFAPDVIYERQLITGGLGAHWGRKWGVKVVHEVNSPHRLEYLYRFPWLAPASGILKAWERRQFEPVSALVTTHALMVPEGFKGKTLVGPWAVSLPSPGENPLDIPALNGRKVILVTGSFRSWHGLDAIKAVVRELGEGPWGILLAGADPQGLWEKELRQASPAPVVSLGRVENSHMGSVYLRADVLLAPFDPPLPEKPFYYSPFKVLEALARGCPVITDAHENLKVLLTEPWCGRLMGPRDPGAWAGALRETLANPRPEALLGRAWAGRHSWEDHARGILEALS